MRVEPLGECTAPPESRQVRSGRGRRDARRRSSSCRGGPAQGSPHERRRERENGGVTPQKIRHLTSVHTISDPRIFHKQCRSLAERGHDVALIACHDRAEIIDGVRIVPIDRPQRSPGPHDAGRLRGLYRAAVREHADLYHFHDPELLWVGVLLRLRGRRVVYDVHEDVPKQIMSKHWIPRRCAAARLQGLRRSSSRLGARIVDGIVAATPSIARKFPAGKTVVVQNFPEASFARADGPAPRSGSGRRVRLHRRAHGDPGRARDGAGLRACCPRHDRHGGRPFHPAALEDEIATHARLAARAVPRPGAARRDRARHGRGAGGPRAQPPDAPTTSTPTRRRCSSTWRAGFPSCARTSRCGSTIVGGADCGIAVDPRDPAGDRRRDPLASTSDPERGPPAGRERQAGGR